LILAENFFLLHNPLTGTSFTLDLPNLAMDGKIIYFQIKAKLGIGYFL